MSASRCAVGPVLPVVMGMITFSLVGDGSVHGRAGGGACNISVFAAVACGIRDGVVRRACDVGEGRGRAPQQMG